ncbi:serine hydrolase [Pseudoalteromonas sp. R3]|uniref:serine hydrolase domain-containing protein n=1 Tax=Pseudoalteromonas sp. R3 TaxID=1709477 RepID=UPI0006B48B9D|nr:serine hydrolase [Pseudoalteromonas sp. R3]AZZ98127.1 class C beta-lactamase-related serine hydrolase [Pseudoalteromonas sp. R3]
MIKHKIVMSLAATVLIGCFSQLTMAKCAQPIEATEAELEGGYRDVAELKNAFIDTAPKRRNDGLAVGAVGIDGGNKALLIKLAQEIENNMHGQFDSLLIAHKGKLVFESYYSRGRINLPHYQASATKVYTSLALGRAIQLGYLTMADLDKPLISFLQGLDTSKLTKGSDKITLNMALTMRSGIRLSDEQKEGFEQMSKQLKGQRHAQALLERSAPISAQSQIFKYQDDPMLVMHVIDAVVPGTAEAFIKQELLDRLGIEQYRWQTADNGLPEAGWRVNMTSRDMLKWGTLASNKGKWQGEQLIPQGYITKAISPQLHTGDEDIFGGGKDVSKQGYGYYWWNAELQSGDKRFYSVSAQGGGGQYIILIEELDLVVVVTANRRENSTLQLMAERVLPAFM